MHHNKYKKVAIFINMFRSLFATFASVCPMIALVYSATGVQNRSHYKIKNKCLDGRFFVPNVDSVAKPIYKKNRFSQKWYCNVPFVYWKKIWH